VVRLHLGVANVERYLAAWYASNMKTMFLALTAVAMGWAVWQFFNGLRMIRPTNDDAEALSRSDGTWNS